MTLALVPDLADADLDAAPTCCWSSRFWPHTLVEPCYAESTELVELAPGHEIRLCARHAVAARAVEEIAL